LDFADLASNLNKVMQELLEKIEGERRRSLEAADGVRRLRNWHVYKAFLKTGDASIEDAPSLRWWWSGGLPCKGGHS
jgi:hypothetical protein